MQTASHIHSIFYYSDRISPVKPGSWMKTKVSHSSQLVKRLEFSGRAQTFKFLIPVRKTRLFVNPNTDDGHPCVVAPDESTNTNTNTNNALNHEAETFLNKWSPPEYLWRGLSIFILAGQVIIRILKGKVHWRNTLQQLERVGPRSAGVCLLTSAFVGMAFTIQFVREFTRLGLNRSVGGVLALAFSRELSPVVTSIVVAGRIGSAFAAELGTMQVSEQTDTLRVLGSNPVDYLVFGGIISIVSCAWGVTTLGGAKGVGESTTSAVVLSLVGIFVADFALSYCFFQGAGDSLKNCV